jgi:AcrR family transcriptional regulator
MKLFLEKGYENTTVLDIVDHMGGLTRGAFYHHFKTKEEVFEAVMKRIHREVAPPLTEKDQEGMNGLEKIRAMVLSQLTQYRENEKFLELQKVNLFLTKNSRFLAEQISENQAQALRMAAWVEEGMADGSIRLGNPKVLSDLFLLFFNFWMVSAIYPCDKSEYMDRVFATKTMLDSLGFPLMNQEVMEKIDVLSELSGF